MAAHSFTFVYHLLCLALLATGLSANLSPNYYARSCPQALQTIQNVVEAAVKQEKRMGASLLRLHFHDCFVNGCDGSVLLDKTSTIDSEKDAGPNVNSARGFDVIDKIKLAVNKACGKPIVSCADILAVAARDSVVALGGSPWTVQLGRRDSTTASRSAANNDIPTPFMSLSALTDNFKKHGLDKNDLVVLSGGGHTIGFAQCQFFRNRIYNSTNIDTNFARNRQATCPRNGGDRNLAPLDPTAAKFDTMYFENLVKLRGLLTSDQALFTRGGGGGATDELVMKYKADAGAFKQAFGKSMIKMGNIKPLTGKQGEVRVNCRKVNSS